MISTKKEPGGESQPAQVYGRNRRLTAPRKDQKNNDSRGFSDLGIFPVLARKSGTELETAWQIRGESVEACSASVPPNVTHAEALGLSRQHRHPDGTAFDVQGGMSVYLEMRLRQSWARAKKSKLGWNISLDYVVQMYVTQKGLCAVSGHPMVYKHHRPKWDDAFAPSIDRIDCNQGYMVGNVRLVCRIANFAMGNWGEAALIELAQAIANKHNPNPTLRGRP